jgi:hypothetical protein
LLVGALASRHASTEPIGRRRRGDPLPPLGMPVERAAQNAGAAPAGDGCCEPPVTRVNERIGLRAV